MASRPEPPPLVILWGGTGQAKLARPIIERAGSTVVAVIDDTPGLRPPFGDVELLLGWEGFVHWVTGRDTKQIGFCVAIGNPHGRVRIRLHERLVQVGLRPVDVFHHTAAIADNATIGEGCQLMAGAIVNPEVSLGRQCIVNINGCIDHEATLEDGCEVAPGAVLCGEVYMETNSWVCAGAVVLPRLRIGADAIVGAGAVVTRDVPPSTTVLGVPAKPQIKAARTEG